MEEIVLRLVGDFGGQWPVIGGSVFLAAVLIVLAWWGSHTGVKFLVLLPAAAAVGVVITIVFGLSSAKAECRRLYSEDRSEYLARNCEVLVNCLLVEVRPSDHCRG